MKDIQSSVCKEESIDVDARSRDSPGQVPGFMDRFTLEYTGHHTGGGAKDDKGHGCPDKPSIDPLNRETEVKAEYRYLRHGNTDVVDELAKVVQLLLESASDVSSYLLSVSNLE